MQIDWIDFVRTFLIFAHVIAVVCASIGIAFADYAVFGRKVFDQTIFSASEKSVTFTLAALWVTGLAIAAIDMWPDNFEITNQQKLLAKLTVALILTLNGVLLKWLVFPFLGRKVTKPGRYASIAAVLGAVSAVSWGYAIFLGLAKPLASAFGYVGFMSFYALVLAMGALGCIRLLKPRLLQKWSVYQQQ